MGDDADPYFDATSPSVSNQPIPFESLTLSTAVNDLGLKASVIGTNRYLTRIAVAVTFFGPNVASDTALHVDDGAILAIGVQASLNFCHPGDMEAILRNVRNLDSSVNTDLSNTDETLANIGKTLLSFICTFPIG